MKDIGKHIGWKLFKHRALSMAGIKHSLIMDVLSPQYSKHFYEEYANTPLTIANSIGCFFSPDTPSAFLREIFVFKIYDRPGFSPCAGWSVADVGAGHGDTTIYWAKCKKARVTAFEPLKDAFDALQKNISLNSIAVTSYNVVVGDGKKVSVIDSGGMMSSSSGGSIVDTVPLDSFVFDTLDLLKIDVEGFEALVLKGAATTITQHRPKVIIETHSSQLAEICDAVMSSHGYKLLWKIPTPSPMSPFPWSRKNTYWNRFYAPIPAS